MSPGLRVPIAVLALAGGVLVGAAATVVHGLSAGLALGLLATLASVLALPPGWWARLPFAAGWLGVVFYFSNPRAEGDYLVAGNGVGYLLLGTGMAIVAFAIITLRPASAGSPGRVGGLEDARGVAEPS